MFNTAPTGLFSQNVFKLDVEANAKWSPKLTDKSAFLNVLWYEAKSLTLSTESVIALNEVKDLKSVSLTPGSYTVPYENVVSTVSLL